MDGTRIYSETKKAFKNGKNVIVHEGGTRSGKTFNIVLFLIKVATRNANIQISIVSQSLPHLKRGALKDFETIMMLSGLFREDQYNRTDRKYTFLNGAYIEFFGVDSWGKVIGSSRDILFANECNKISYVTFQQLSWRTRIAKILDYNPSDIEHWVYDLGDTEKGVLIHSTYKDNPYLTTVQREEIESIKDPDLFRVFAEGKRGINVNGIIFRNYETIDGGVPEGYKLRYMGMDFGYSPDPTALVEVWSGTDYGTIYLREVIYETRLTATMLKHLMNAKKVSKSVIIVGDTSHGAIFAELNYAGFIMKKATKGAGSVRAGVLNMKRFNLLLDRNSTNLVREIQRYSEILDIDGKPTGVINTRNDHTIDASRYAIDEYTRYYLPELTRFE